MAQKSKNFGALFKSSAEHRQFEVLPSQGGIGSDIYCADRFVRAITQELKGFLESLLELIGVTLINRADCIAIVVDSPNSFSIISCSNQRHIELIERDGPEDPWRMRYEDGEFSNEQLMIRIEQLFKLSPLVLFVRTLLSKTSVIQEIMPNTTALISDGAGKPLLIICLGKKEDGENIFNLKSLMPRNEFLEGVEMKNLGRAIAEIIR